MEKIWDVKIVDRDLRYKRGMIGRGDTNVSVRIYFDNPTTREGEMIILHWLVEGIQPIKDGKKIGTGDKFVDFKIPAQALNKIGRHALEIAFSDDANSTYTTMPEIAFFDVVESSKGLVSIQPANQNFKLQQVLDDINKAIAQGDLSSYQKKSPQDGIFYGLKNGGIEEIKEMFAGTYVDENSLNADTSITPMAGMFALVGSKGRTKAFIYDGVAWVDGSNLKVSLGNSQDVTASASLTQVDAGVMFYNTAERAFYVWTGTTWQKQTTDSYISGYKVKLVKP